MAYAITANFNFRDAKGGTAVTKVRVPTALTIAQAVEFAQEMGQVLVDASNCILESVNISLDIDLSGAAIKAAANFVADVAEKGSFIFRSAVSRFQKVFNLPTILDTIFPVGSEYADLADPDVAAYVTLVEDGATVTSGTLSLTDNREHDLVSVVDGHEQFRTRY